MPVPGLSHAPTTIALHTVKAATGPIPRRSATTAPIPTSDQQQHPDLGSGLVRVDPPEYGKPSVSPSAR